MSQTALRYIAAVAAYCGVSIAAATGFAQTPSNAPASVVCPGCDLHGQSYAGQTIVGGNFANANLSGANFAGATIAGVVFTGANLSGASFAGATIGASGDAPTDFINANLTNANFASAKIAGPAPAAKMQYANASGANFTNANLTGAQFGPSPVLGTGSQAANFTGASLGCGLAVQAGPLGIAGAVMPNGCPVAAAAQTTGPAAWLCPNTTLASFTRFVYVTTSGTDSDTCGTTPAAACQTIARGVSQCSGASCAVLAAYGRYAVASGAPIALAANTSLFGGCLASSIPEPSDFSLVTAPSGGAPAVTASGATNASVQGFAIVGSAAIAPGTPSVAVSLSNNSSIAFAYVSVTGGAGAAGAPGVTGTPGAAGGSASSQTGGTSTCGAAGGTGGYGQNYIHAYHSGSKVTTCANGCVASGQKKSCTNNGNPSTCFTTCATATNGSPDGIGGGWYGNSGGQCPTGTNNVQSCPSMGGSNGGNGKPGNCGFNGIPSAAIAGTFTNGQWSASMATSGQNGTAGGGGAGGSGGGACALLAGTLGIYNQFDYLGANGGGGAAGGCGATLGGGGQQGGASIAIQAVASTVTLNSVRVAGGPGGAGGNGGTGGAMTPPGSVAWGVTAAQNIAPRQTIGAPTLYTGGGNGGIGGTGGWGGGGGGGAGGGGGPSFGLLLAQNGALNPPANGFLKPFWDLGISGAIGAAGGTAPTPNSGLVCGMQASPAALLGTVQAIQNF